MQLIVAIVQDEDAGLATDALTTAGFRVTRINTMGGFLRKGNATLAIATEPSQVQRALLLIRDNCERRSEFFVPTAPRRDRGAVSTGTHSRCRSAEPRSSYWTSNDSSGSSAPRTQVTSNR